MGFLVCWLCYQHLQLEVKVLVEIKMKLLTWLFFFPWGFFFWFLGFVWILTFSCVCRWRSLGELQLISLTGQETGFVFCLERSLCYTGMDWSWEFLLLLWWLIFFSLLLGISAHHWGISRAPPGSARCSASCLKAHFFQRHALYKVSSNALR